MSYCLNFKVRARLLALQSGKSSERKQGNSHQKQSLPPFSPAPIYLDFPPAKVFKKSFEVSFIQILKVILTNTTS